MARVAITEYAAKKLFLGDAYPGVSITPENVEEMVAALDAAQDYIVKVDVGIKKRGKQGLVRLGVTKEGLLAAADELFALGHERCLVEPMLPHEEAAERYISLDLQRDGVQVLHSNHGGVAIEEDPDSVSSVLVSPTASNAQTQIAGLETVPLADLLEKMAQWHVSFCEINPYIVQDDTGFYPLDMAVEIDSAKEARLPDWIQPHVLHKKATSPQEAAVLEQDARTQAALNLHTLNENGAILTLFSGGGASLVALDSLVTAGLSEQVINYSEYSGAPTRDETAAYVDTLLSVLRNSNAKHKVVLIAGGVANFTDVMATFQGIVDAFNDNLETLTRQNVYVCVRRGGPNQTAGLAHLEDFLTTHGIDHDVHGPTLSLGAVGDLVAEHV